MIKNPEERPEDKPEEQARETTEYSEGGLYEEPSYHRHHSMKRVVVCVRYCWGSLIAMAGAILTLFLASPWAGIGLTLVSAAALSMAKWNGKFVKRASGVLKVGTLNQVSASVQAATLGFVIGMMLEIMVLLFRIINR